MLEKLCEGGGKEGQGGEDDGLLPRISLSFLFKSTDGGERVAAAGASCPMTPQFSEAQEGISGKTWCADRGVRHFNSGEFVSREGIFKAILGHMNTGTHVAAAAAAKVSPVANDRRFAFFFLIFLDSYPFQIKFSISSHGKTVARQ